ncbi:MAG: hypothetical protein JXM79_01250, partial [Sedimentisphaerales bacterium]|nr:hypothetical protein [Sedimentisphaerales bacterium]
AEIPPIQEYSDDGRHWNTDAICWVSVADDAKWNTIESEYASAELSNLIVPLVRDELRNIGHPVIVFLNQYITREKRLSIQKVIFCKEFEIKKTMVREGICYDMHLTLEVVNYPQQEQTTLCQVWGRSLVDKDKTASWDDIYRVCVSNLRYAPEFREALEVDASDQM